MSKNLSAIKKTQVSIRNNIRNKIYKSIIKNLTRKYLSNVNSINSEDEQELRSAIYSSIDKAVKRGVIHKNNGARKKSKIARSSKNLST
uniref:Ribosomal protein S20 n=1 Tax=Asparagopsis taxiformis TaxID=260499 RepID=A0A1C9CC46_9FLOR|nr:ribosomal protein S20 [Asparagopsis taxiformis]AOM65914.1 ribosomal protein S20 [Asparagopsis taxiformis]